MGADPVFDLDGPWVRWWRVPVWHTTSWLATHPRVRGWFVLHAMPPESLADPDPMAEMLRGLARSPHPGLVRVHHVSLDDRGLRWVTAVAPGEPLGRTLSRAWHTRAPFAAPEAVRRAIDLATGLAHLRGCTGARGPLDLLGAREGGEALVLVEGWRAAITANDALFHATTNVVIRHTPPEVLQGRDWDEGCDVWGVGAVLYECLFAERLDALAAMRALPRLASPGTVPPGLVAVLRDALALDPRRRCARLGDLVGALAPFAPAARDAVVYRTDPRTALATAAAAQDLPRAATLLAANPGVLTEEFSRSLWRSLAESLLEDTRDGRADEATVILWTALRPFAGEALRALRDDRRTHLASHDFLDVLLDPAVNP